MVVVVLPRVVAACCDGDQGKGFADTVATTRLQRDSRADEPVGVQPRALTTVGLEFGCVRGQYCLGTLWVRGGERRPPRRS